MARPKILPLPDPQARRVIAAADALETAYPDSSRAFLGAFIAEVYDITGEVYGHPTYREMLNLYARTWPHKPSSETISKEIHAFKALLASSRVPAPDPETRRLEAAISVRAVELPRRSAPARPAPVTGQAADSELARLQLLEIVRLRDALSTNTAGLERAERQRQLAADGLTHANAQLAALQASYELETKRYAELLTEVGRGQERADASHRHALLQVEHLRAETRAAQAQTEQARRKITALEQQLVNERAISDGLRRQRNEQSAAQREQQ
jgi:chromosome segregation ATPase